MKRSMLMKRSTLMKRSPLMKRSTLKRSTLMKLRHDESLRSVTLQTERRKGHAASVTRRDATHDREQSDLYVYSSLLFDISEVYKRDGAHADGASVERPESDSGRQRHRLPAAEDIWRGASGTPPAAHGVGGGIMI
ncbi:hypothetical protein EYF80_056758 [Liparis tanakae]|uniref:Uncharacterized protein n=1 Tax=Liparis tanakae TaxID=230148 RepID=A0A4Z2EW08_9TELE|nr:hypothetical protein EYF80_056758 [Liparis tanakae]